MDGSCPFYRCYECADGGYVAVGALERQFFEALWTGLGLGEPPEQYPRSRWPDIERALTAAFKQRGRDEWAAYFHGRDACVTPVLTPHEVAAHPQVVHRHGDLDPRDIPSIPRFGRTPSVAGELDRSDRTVEVLAELGLTPTEIEAAHDRTPSKGLDGFPDM